MNIKKYRKPLLIGLCVALVCLVLLGIAWLILRGIGAGLTDQQAAERWERGDLSYTQVSCFLSGDMNLTTSQIRYVEAEMNSKVTADSYAAPEDARLWLDCYSAQTKLPFSADKGSTQARTFCVGGDFFYFHPLEMTSGWYFSGEELMETGVILDEQLAWQLFGGLEVTGMPLTVGDIRCTVLGVTKGPEARGERRAYGTEEPSAYVSIALAERLNGSVPVTCYEAVVPNPVKDYGVRLVKESLNFSEGSFEYVENKNRYTPLRVISQLKNADARIVRTDNIVYPYWENAARLADSRAYFAGIALIVCLVPPLLYVLTWIVILFIHKEVLIKSGFGHVSRVFHSILAKIRQKKEKKA